MVTSKDNRQQRLCHFCSVSKDELKIRRLKRNDAACDYFLGYTSARWAAALHKIQLLREEHRKSGPVLSVDSQHP